VPFEIIPPGTHIDFLGRRRIAFAVSAVLFLAGIAAIPVQGFRLGIDFAGGTEVQLRFPADADVDEGKLRSVVGACGVRDAAVVRYGEADITEFLIRFREGAVGENVDDETSCPLSDAQREEFAATDAATGADASAPGTAAIVDRLVAGLENVMGDLEVLRVEYVGPRVGDELRRDGVLSLLIACGMIIAYIAFRFSSRFAPGAIVALVHDIGITAGIFVIFGMEFDLRVLAALLAILGYSLNDTIIIYDRIRENMELHTKHDLVDVLNRSVNQTLSRTVLTSLSTLGAVGALLLVGGEVIRPFALAMAIGIAVGTYSSTFIAAPTLLYLETRFGAGSGQSGPRHPKESASKGRGAGKSRSGKAARV
jgi:preprotein translocase subunit SecF